MNSISFFGMSLLPLVYVALVLYLVFRFVQAFERGVAAFERLATALARPDRG